ncbi:MAG: carboxypeptidase-like regulatory domain-containing protein [Bacteroidales bacterium]|nr:carboxypeptidase-like regulatory domain-containing protein [Bacteroidales bacterium]
MNGKDICKELKSLRRQIASDNGIPLDIPECDFKGECNGTCPRCDAELKSLERQLQLRNAIGKAAVIAGVAFSLASSQPVFACDTHDSNDTPREQCRKGRCSLTGTVVFSKSNDPVWGCTVLLKRNNEVVATAVTDSLGMYKFERLGKGEYEFLVLYETDTIRKIVSIEEKKTVFHAVIERLEAPLMGIIPVRIDDQDIEEKAE